MAFTPYHNILGTAGLDQQLIRVGENVTNIKSILLTNVHGSNDATVSLFIQDNPTAAAANTFYILSTVAIPSDMSLLLNDVDLLDFDNSSAGYGLYITVASGDKVDVFINR